MSVNIYIGNLSYDVSESKIEELFLQYGEVTSVKIIIDQNTGRSKGFGFIEMNDKNEAENAILGLNGTEILGRDIKVNMAKPKNDTRKFKNRY